MTVRKSLKIAAVASALMLGAVGCGAGGGGADDDTILVGISIPLTGDFAEPGKGVERGYQVWADTVNAGGGLLGRQVKLKILDDKSQAEAVVADYEALIAQDQADLIFGPYSSRLVIPAARVAQEYGMLFVEPAGNAAEVFEQGFDNLFYSGPAVADNSFDFLVDYILAMPEDQRPKTAAVATMDDPFPKATAHGVRDRLAAGGIKIVVDEEYPPNQIDFSTLAAKIAPTRADVVIGGAAYQDAVNLIIALQQLDYQPKIAGFTTAPTHPEFASALGARTAGILAPTSYSADANVPTNAEFVAAYEAKYNHKPNEDEAAAFATGQVVQAAVENVGCAEQGECQQQLIDYLRTAEVPTVVGPLAWDEDGRPKGASMVLQWQDGEAKIVLPEAAAESEIIVPKPGW
ncbi:ABC transporter substrate-binding protein [Mycolicibacterium chitae]|uniref:ABC transporter periplasmic protein n=1 Tax=Mycolicibacterium chitae TaxID=1792 RepID=A0A3S4REY8_MYCCI|nr:amino acid ABC transporter substrate-binding protein [Mycolicibacterium chitae]BBZ03332.1 ABC transporter substrate-binding protein [Mycolicibacterium chitae]VEG46768.1 ABC transporter periplasmic protein [Mycolicibacterium chitae]